MPAPEHLLPILERLGDGGTVGMAEIVHSLVEDARAGAATPPPAEAFEAGKTYIIRNLDSASPFMDDGEADYPAELSEIAARVGCEFVVFDPSVQVAASDLAAVDAEALADALTSMSRLATELLYLDVEPETGEYPNPGEATWEAAVRAIKEARSWARHGYELGQRSCSWSDQGVAPAWLTEGWPTSFPSDLAPPGDTHQAQHDTYADGQASAADSEPDPDATQEHAIDWDDEPDAKQPAAETSPSPGAAASAADIRAWAREADIDVPAKGFIPKTVRAQYDAAHPEA